MSANVQIRQSDSTLGEYLVAAGKLSRTGLERAIRVHEENGERLDTLYSRLGLVTEHDLAESMARYLHIELATPADFPESPVLEERINHKFIKQARIIPVAEQDNAVIVAMADPLDERTIEALIFAVGKPIKLLVGFPADIDAAYERLYGKGKSALGSIVDESREETAHETSEDIDRLRDQASEAPVIRLVNLLITRAVEVHASDIHLEPIEDRLRVRLRIDGVLQEVESPPARLRGAIVSRIKIMARLNIAEKRLSQDGRIRLAVRGKDIDFRVSTAPTIHGESVVMRILDRGHLVLDFATLGFDQDILGHYREALARPHGIVLVTGPTGSGKTTTLYASLLTLNTPDKKILTIEDPIEYQLEGVNQVQVKPQIGLTFASALRSFLRQDPDIMMIGEIRDLETAQIAVQAALTGHLILSTLHTNNAASAITRLLDMGVEDYLLTSTVNALVAQRLVRLLCAQCREPFRPAPELVERMQLRRICRDNVITLYRPVGCVHCGATGYRGRTTIIEVLPMSDGIRQLILRRVEARAIERSAIESGMQTMFFHGMRKALAGRTTIEEVLRVTGDF